MSKVFITGATGFIGTHLARLLVKRGHEVRCLVRTSSNTRFLEPLGVQQVVGDLTDPESLARAIDGVEAVYHLAGLTRAARNDDFFTVNAAGVRHVAQVCAARETPPVLVVVSSLAAAGASDRDHPRDETAPPEPVSPYGKSKLAGEYEALALADRVPITVVRPPVIFGEGDTTFVPFFRQIERTGWSFVPGFRQKPFSFLHAADLSEVLLRCARGGERLQTDSLPPKNSAGDWKAEPPSPSWGRGIYFAAYQQFANLSEFSRLIGEGMKPPKKVRVLHVPPRVVLAIGLAGEGYKRLRNKMVPLDWDKAKESLGGPWTCDGRKAIEQFDGLFPKTLRQRIAQSLNWYFDPEGFQPEMFEEPVDHESSTDRTSPASEDPSCDFRP